MSYTICSQVGADVAFRYRCGDIVLFESSALYHSVGAWKPSVGVREGITPGRIGHVFFFPKKSLQNLEDSVRVRLEAEAEAQAAEAYAQAEADAQAAADAQAVADVQAEVEVYVASR